VLLRGDGYPDALPAGDAGLRRQVFRHYGLASAPSEAELTAIAEAWRPYRSWATLYLWSAEWAVNPAVDSVEPLAIMEPENALN
jgi:DNA-3-methyladenine glycosylase II